jgi:hypothetical protein
VLKKIVSGGQTGADIAGVDAAIECGFEYGGWLPKGRKTEDGSLPEKYRMTAMARGGYPKRTEQNVIDSSGTVIFTHKKLTGGSKLTADLAESWGKPWLHINFSEMPEDDALEILAEWLKRNEIETLNVAGSRASKDSNVYQKVFSIIKNIIESK